jgi:hypothetical protein
MGFQGPREFLCTLGFGSTLFSDTQLMLVAPSIMEEFGLSANIGWSMTSVKIPYIPGTFMDALTLLSVFYSLFTFFHS